MVYNYGPWNHRKNKNHLYLKKKYVHETFRVEPLTTKSENSKTDGQAQPSSLQLITPPPAYQCLEAQHLPSAPQLQQQTSQFHDKIPPNELP